MTGRVTLFDSPDVLAKTWSLDAAGAPVKTVAAQLYRGNYSVHLFENVDELAELLEDATTHQAISCSLPVDGSMAGAITTMKQAAPGAKVRSKSTFVLRPSPGVLFLDHDAADATKGMTRDDLWSCLVSAVPALGSAGVVWRPSGSSHIFKGDVDLTGLRGQHLFVMLADASDAARVIGVLAARLWLAGLGTIHVSKAGSLLVRCPIDTAPCDAARLVFSGGAECGPGLDQRRGPAVILNRGDFLDSRSAVRDLSSDDLARYEALVEQAKMAAAPQAALCRAEHRGTVIAERLPRMMRGGMSAADAEQKIAAAVDAAYCGTLLAEFVLTVVHEDGRRESVTVGEVLANRERWDEVDCLDPINPGHRRGAADCRLYTLGTSPIAYSLDDGGKLYRLRSAQQRLMVSKGNRGELVQQIAATVAADERVFSTDTGPVLIEQGKMHALTVQHLMNLVGSLLVLVVKTAKGETLTDMTTEVGILVLAALGV